MAELGFAATLSVNDGSSSAQQAFSEVVMITPPKYTVSNQKTTHLLSSKINGVIPVDTFLPGTADPGELSCEANFSKADYSRLIALVGVSKTWVASSPDGSAQTQSFTGWVSDGPEVVYETDAVVKTKWKTKCTGVITVA